MSKDDCLVADAVRAEVRVFLDTGIHTFTAFQVGGGRSVQGVILFVVVINLYFMAKGTSMGKRLLGMRVYRVSGKPAGFFLMLVEETIGKMISGLVFSLGFLWLLWDKDVQCWHDKVVGTVVLREKESA
ncbi:MAG: RDD family protein [Thermoleophilia bacterium]|nr:RDD family protein [Thermoleophilia bacterium]